MKIRWPLYVVFGVVFYLLFLIVEMPASWFAWGIYKYTSGAVRLDPVAGSLWHGNGRVVVYYPRTTPHDLGNAQWRINPLWLSTGRIRMRWQTNTPEMLINTTIALGYRQLQLTDTTATLTAKVVSAFYPPAALIAPQGQIHLNIDRLTLGSKGVDGKAEILWQNAASGLSSVRPLGDYRLAVAGAGNIANLRLTTAQGVLQLAGQGIWKPEDGRLQFSGSASPTNRAEELRPLLKLIGNEQGGGRRSFAFNGRFPSPIAIR